MSVALACLGIFAPLLGGWIIAALAIPTPRDLANFDEDTEAH